MKDENWFKRELKDFIIPQSTKDLMIELALRNKYPRSLFKEMCEDALWYSAEDFMKIHNSNWRDFENDNN